MLTHITKMLNDGTVLVICNNELLTEFTRGFVMFCDFIKKEVRVNFENLNFLAYRPRKTEFVVFIGKMEQREEIISFWRFAKKAYQLIERENLEEFLAEKAEEFWKIVIREE